MINDNDILRERKERIEIHKRSLEDGSLRNYSEDNNYSNPIVFQTILCLFIFAFILVIKLTNIDITENLKLTLTAQLEKDNLPQIMSFMENTKNEFAFSPYENIEGSSHDYIEESATSSDIENTISSDIENTYNMIPTTEFTIDENMLSDISEDTAFLEKK